MTKLPKILSHIFDVPAYVPGAHGDNDDALILSANENPYGCSQYAKTAMSSVQNQLHRYPAGYPSDLHDGLAKLHGLNKDKLILTAGSDELITLLTRAFLQKNDEIIMSQYGFLMYDISARLCGAITIKAKETDYKTDIDAILNAITPKTKIIFIANPNNPTGSVLSNEELDDLHRRIPPHIMFIIDEAYGEYMDETSHQPAFHQFKDAPNVMITRTFSKIYGLAGLRLGWGYGDQKIIDGLNRIRSPFNTSLPAQKAGEAAIKDQDFIKQSIKNNHENRDLLSKSLYEIGHNQGWIATPSHTNFILLRLHDECQASALDSYLRQKNIYVRAMKAYDLPHCLRITVGTRDENDRLINALKAYEA